MILLLRLLKARNFSNSIWLAFSVPDFWAFDLNSFNFIQKENLYLILRILNPRPLYSSASASDSATDFIPIVMEVVAAKGGESQQAEVLNDNPPVPAIEQEEKIFTLEELEDDPLPRIC